LAVIPPGQREAGAYPGMTGLPPRPSPHRYDVVILDRDLPKVHGDEVCRRIVAAGGETRVLLTAAAGIRDRVEGLEGPRSPSATPASTFRPNRCPRCSSRSAGSPPTEQTTAEAPALGLSIVRSITAAHSGTVQARPRPGGGLIVQIDLPPASAAAAPYPRSARSPESRSPDQRLASLIQQQPSRGPAPGQRR
jgi:CheY-like chemotaxis protein